MLLPQQIQSILFHLLMGWVYVFGFSFITNFIKYVRFSFIKGLIEIMYHLIFTSLMFFCLYHINGGITNIYLIGFFCTGMLLYYFLYLNTFYQIFYRWEQSLRPIYKKLLFLRDKLVQLVRLPFIIRKKRKVKRKKRKEQKKQEKNKKKEIRKQKKKRKHQKEKIV